MEKRPQEEGRVGVVPGERRGRKDEHINYISARVREDGEEEDDDEEEEEEEEQIASLNELATFQSVVVWDHEKIIEGNEDALVKGLNEWIHFAEAVRLELVSFLSSPAFLVPVRSFNSDD